MNNISKINRINKTNKASKKAQVWIETVIYTLIGLTIIGILLAVSKPKIDEKKDELIIEQTIDSLNKIDSVIYNVAYKGAGNKRNPDLKVSKGKFIIDSEQDSVSWEIDSKFKYSEPELIVPLGRLKVLTTKSNPWKVNLWINYTFDLVSDTGNKKEFSVASTPYQLYIENQGVVDNKVIVKISSG